MTPVGMSGVGPALDDVRRLSWYGLGEPEERPARRGRGVLRRRSTARVIMATAALLTVSGSVGPAAKANPQAKTARAIRALSTWPGDYVAYYRTAGGHDIVLNRGVLRDRVPR